MPKYCSDDATSKEQYLDRIPAHRLRPPVRSALEFRGARVIVLPRTYTYSPQQGHNMTPATSSTPQPITLQPKSENPPSRSRFSYSAIPNLDGKTEVFHLGTHLSNIMPRVSGHVSSTPVAALDHAKCHCLTFSDRVFTPFLPGSSGVCRLLHIGEKPSPDTPARCKTQTPKAHEPLTCD